MNKAVRDYLSDDDVSKADGLVAIERKATVGHVLSTEVGQKVVGLDEVALYGDPVVVAALRVDSPQGIDLVRRSIEMLSYTE